MADVFVKTCFAFYCSAAEWALLQEAFLLSFDLCAGVEPNPPGPGFMALFPPDDEDRWSGFRDLFSDRDYPDFGADLAGGPEDGSANWRAIISAEVSLEPLAIAALIQRCCAAALAGGPIGFAWSTSCSRQVIDAFGGGWCAVFSDHVALETTGAALAKAIAPSAASGSI